MSARGQQPQPLLYGSSATSSIASALIRRTSLSLHTAPSATTEKKLTRTRRMSEMVQHKIRQQQQQQQQRSSVLSPKVLRIPTEEAEITRAWALLVLNQYLLKHGREMLAKEEQIRKFSVKDCKASVGDFSCTYQVCNKFVCRSLTHTHTVTDLRC